MAPIRVLHRLSLSSLYDQHVRGVKTPAIAPRSAVLLSLLFTLVYVAPLYLSSATRPSRQLPRDAPSSIRARIQVATLSCVVCAVATICVMRQYDAASAGEVLGLLGWWPISLVDTARTLLLVALLFAGPLFEAGVVDGRWRDWVRGTRVREVLSSWIGYRNFVAGPVTEELVWRSLIVPLHLLARVPGKTIVFGTPLYFALAHIHHFYEFRLSHPHTPASHAVLRSVLQLTYTSLFGFFAAFVFLRTGNLLSVCLAHSFCNWMGLPRLWGRVQVEPGVPLGPPDLDKKADSSGPVRGRVHKLLATGAGWTAAYYAILVAGAVGFYWQLFPWTESSHALPVVLMEE